MTRISDLPTVIDIGRDEYIPVMGDGMSSKVSLDGIIEAVKKSMGYDRVLEKCNHCGQWGAVMCACPACGAPIDPKPMV